MTPRPPWWRRAADGALIALVVCLPLSISGTQVALGVLLACVGVALLFGERPIRRSPLDVPLLLFFAALVLSTVLGGPSWRALDAYRGLWVVGMYVAAIAWLGNGERAGRLVRVLVLTAAAVALYGIVQHFTGIDVYRALVGRRTLVKPSEYDPTRYVVIGFFPNYLTYAHSLMIPLAWAVAGVVRPGGWNLGRAASAGSALLMLVALLLSTARGAWLAAAALLMTGIFVGDRRRHVGLVAALAGAAALLFVVSPALRAEGRSLIQRRANAARLAIYGANLDVIRDHPAFGLGFGNYDRRVRVYYDRHPHADRRSHAHNSLLQIAAEAGMVGALAFCYLFGVIVVRGWRLVRRLGRAESPLWATAAGAWLGVVGFLVGGLTQDTFGDSECAMPMWFACAVLMVVDRQVTSDGPAAHPPR